MEKPKKVGVGVSLREDDVRTLDRYAELMRTSRSQIINDLVAQKLPEFKAALNRRA